LTTLSPESSKETTSFQERGELPSVLKALIKKRCQTTSTNDGKDQYVPRMSYPGERSTRYLREVKKMWPSRMMRATDPYADIQMRASISTGFKYT